MLMLGFTEDERLVLKSPLDREKRAHYDVSLFTTDWGSPPLTSRATLLLSVIDVNDCAPEFENDSLAITFAENNSPPVFKLYLFLLKQVDCTEYSTGIYCTSVVLKLLLVSVIRCDTRKG